MLKLLYITILFLLSYPLYAASKPVDDINIDLSRFRVGEQLTEADIAKIYDTKINRKEYWKLRSKDYNFDDIACYIAENYPSEIDSFFPIGHRWIPLCERLRLSKNVPEAKTLFDKTWKLSGRGYYGCGSIYKDHIASDNIKDVVFGANPELALVGSRKLSIEQLSELNETIRLWGSQGVWEKNQVAQVQKIAKKALHAISSYYIKKYGHSEQKAQEYAKYVVNHNLMNGFGSHSKYAFKGHVPDEMISKFLHSNDISVLNNRFNGKPEYMDIPSYNQWIAAMLRSAVVNKRPIADINKLLSLLERPIESDLLLHPLHVASANYVDALDAILRYDSKIVNIANSFGKTALMYAIQYKNIDAVKLLLKKGADVNQLTYDYKKMTLNRCDPFHYLEAYSRSALIYSAWHATPEIVQMLLDSGAKDEADSTKKTACDYIYKNENLSHEQNVSMRKLLCENVTELGHKQAREKVGN